MQRGRPATVKVFVPRGQRAGVRGVSIVGLVAVVAACSGRAIGESSAASDAAGAVRTASTRSADTAGFRFLTPPVVIFSPRANRGRPAFVAVMRISRRLPAPREVMYIGKPDFERPYKAAFDSYCYTQRATEDQLPQALRRPRDGQLTTVTFGVTYDGGQKFTKYDAARVRIRQVTEDEISGDQDYRPILRRMGCRRPK